MKSYHLSFVSGSAPGFVSRAGAGEMFGLGKCSSTVLALEEFGVPVELVHLLVVSQEKISVLGPVGLDLGASCLGPALRVLGLLVLARRSGSWALRSWGTELGCLSISFIVRFVCRFVSLRVFL